MSNYLKSAIAGVAGILLGVCFGCNSPPPPEQYLVLPVTKVWQEQEDGKYVTYVETEILPGEKIKFMERGHASIKVGDEILALPWLLPKDSEKSVDANPAVHPDDEYVVSIEATRVEKKSDSSGKVFTWVCFAEMTRPIKIEGHQDWKPDDHIPVHFSMKGAGIYRKYGRKYKPWR